MSILPINLYENVVLMLAEGWTVRQIRIQLQADPSIPKDKVPTETALLKIAAENASEIGSLREDLAVDLTQRGLVLKEVRLLHLQRLYENWAKRAESDTKAAGLALNILKQIQGEVEPFNFSLILGRSDPWQQLLSEIRDSGKQSIIPDQTQPLLTSSPPNSDLNSPSPKQKSLTATDD